MKKAILIFAVAACLLSACGKPADTAAVKQDVQKEKQNSAGSSEASLQNSGEITASTPTVSGRSNSSNADKGTSPSGKNGAGDIQTVANPTSTDVLVNKQHKLPENYAPDDLVYPNVRFTFKEKIEKRMMRKEAAQALEKLFKAADKDGLPLAGVSAYRSHKRQKAIFEAYVQKDGEEKARTYSAYPGTSEHETGLAIDVTKSDGSCAATGCFAGTPEAKWLAEHAHEFGFIIRYPKGKENITGYSYEPWHLRYVGQPAADDMFKNDLTFEEYAEQLRVASGS
ncbi:MULTISPECIES: M15 family metallopeptidase [Paenibacillus]|uniref:Carboxypeptidase YodJ n=1 Tax=Paenibacillus albilobatus TaxID=2716884 RepID=A0A920C7Y2_9BACL|nr:MULTISPECIES: M15 family metallopeptidase [Paenibacillus]GIO29350.1 putative carboxypeptidase YodJ [Paenibacillus albilobatus]